MLRSLGDKMQGSEGRHTSEDLWMIQCERGDEIAHENGYTHDSVLHGKDDFKIMVEIAEVFWIPLSRRRGRRQAEVGKWRGKSKERRWLVGLSW